MRPLLILLVGLSTLLSVVAGEEDPRQAILETVKALCSSQRSDGAWTDPDSVVRLTAIAPPQRAGEPPPPAIGVHQRYRPWVAELCSASESLWLVWRIAPEAEAAADRALTLAARALLADQTRIPELTEAIDFLRALRGRSVEKVPELTIASNLCREALDRAVARVSVDGIHLGLIDPERNGLIDLRFSWRAYTVPGLRFRSYIPFDDGSEWPRVSRFQPQLAEISSNREERIPPQVPFVDGTLFAAAMACSEQSDSGLKRFLEWIQPLCEPALTPDSDPELLLAAARVFRTAPDDQPGAWWVACQQRLTAGLLATCKRQDGALVWKTRPGETQAQANAFGLRWLQTQHAHQLRRSVLGHAQRVETRLAVIAKQQTSDGSWRDPMDGRDLTAAACLALMGAGYDHVTPNRYHDRLRDGVRFLLKKPDAAPVRLTDRALDAMALAEAQAMTNDQALRGPLELRIKGLLAAALPGGGWSETPATTVDWATSLAVVMALRSATASGLLPPDGQVTAVAAWWFSAIGDGTGDDAKTAIAKAVGAIFLPRGHDYRDALLSRLERAVATTMPLHPRDTWLSGLALIFHNSRAWDAWREKRLTANDEGAPLADQLWLLQADLVLMRFPQALGD